MGYEEQAKALKQVDLQGKCRLFFDSPHCKVVRVPFFELFVRPGKLACTY